MGTMGGQETDCVMQLTARGGGLLARVGVGDLQHMSLEACISLERPACMYVHPVHVHHSSPRLAVHGVAVGRCFLHHTPSGCSCLTPCPPPVHHACHCRPQGPNGEPPRGYLLTELRKVRLHTKQHQMRMAWDTQAHEMLAGCHYPVGHAKHAPVADMM